MSEDEEDFEEQLRFEQLEKQRSDRNEVIEHGRIRKDSDGTEYEWDAEKKAWFPKISEDFIASYQMNYGTSGAVTASGSNPSGSAHSILPPVDVASDPAAYWRYYYANKPPELTDPNYTAWYQYFYGTTDSSQQVEDEDDDLDVGDPGYARWYYKKCYGVEPDELDEQYLTWANSLVTAGDNPQDMDPLKDKSENSDGAPKAKKKKPEPTWFQPADDHNTSVYVAGLPDDITEEELKDIMTKCGLIAFDYETKKMKIKIYKDGSGKPKGDALCTYIKRESVDLALQLLDDSEIRGYKIGVQPAKFELKGDFNPTLRKKPKNNKLKRREKEKQSKLLDWRPDKLPGERPRWEKTVVLKNLFDPAEFDKNPTAIQEIREDLRQECSGFGEIKKITIYDRNQDGVVTVTYKEFEEADLCVESLHHRWFGGRRVLAALWNGKERYDVKETAEQEAERIRKWEEFLVKGGPTDSVANEAIGADLASAKGHSADLQQPSSLQDCPATNHGQSVANHGQLPANQDQSVTSCFQPEVDQHEPAGNLDQPAVN